MEVEVGVEVEVGYGKGWVVEVVEVVVVVVVLVVVVVEAEVEVGQRFRRTATPREPGWGISNINPNPASLTPPAPTPAARRPRPPNACTPQRLRDQKEEGGGKREMAIADREPRSVKAAHPHPEKLPRDLSVTCTTTFGLQGSSRRWGSVGKQLQVQEGNCTSDRLMERVDVGWCIRINYVAPHCPSSPPPPTPAMSTTAPPGPASDPCELTHRPIIAPPPPPPLSPCSCVS